MAEVEWAKAKALSLIAGAVMAVSVTVLLSAIVSICVWLAGRSWNLLVIGLILGLLLVASFAAAFAWATGSVEEELKRRKGAGAERG
jgi:hypothetical protein